MRVVAKLADGMLNLILPRKSAAAESCWVVQCGCINGQKSSKVCCPGFCSACLPTGGAC